MHPVNHIALIWFIIDVCVIVMIVLAAFGFQTLQTWRDQRRIRRARRRPPGNV